jgi:UDP-glucose 4-epimerase
MRILVTGGNGFIGSALVVSLLAEGHQVTVVTYSKVIQLKPHENLLIKIGDYADLKFMDEYLPGMDCLIHLAYTTVPENSVKDPVFDIDSNVISSLRLIEGMHKNFVKKLIFVSSGGVIYGENNSIISENSELRPISSYGISKYILEKNIDLLSQQLEIQSCILRIANAYGRGQHAKRNQGVINIWSDNIRNEKEINLIGTGDLIRDFIHIDDVVSAFHKVLEKNVTGTFNIGTGVGTNLNRILNLLEEAIGKKALIKYIPNRGFDVSSNILSTDFFRNKTGWNPLIDIRTGIHRVINEVPSF